MLERVKHFFDDERLVFLFATNVGQLQHTIKKYYGNGFDGYDYLDRFFDIKFSLPEADLEKIERDSGISQNYVYFNVCKAVANHFDISIRKRKKYFEFSKIAGYYVTKRTVSYIRDGEYLATEFSIMYIVPLLLYYRLFEIEKYYSFIQGKLSEEIQILNVILQSKQNIEGYLFENNEKQIDDNIKKDEIFTRKLLDVYNSLFVMNEKQEKTIGICLFNRNIGKKIIEISNIMSDFTPYENDI